MKLEQALRKLKERKCRSIKRKGLIGNIVVNKTDGFEFTNICCKDVILLASDILAEDWELVEPVQKVLTEIGFHGVGGRFIRSNLPPDTKIYAYLDEEI